MGRGNGAAIARDLAAHGRGGVRSNAVAPGWVNTRIVEGFSEKAYDQIEVINPLGR